MLLEGSTRVFVNTSSLVVLRCLVSLYKTMIFQWIDFGARFGENYIILREHIHFYVGLKNIWRCDGIDRFSTYFFTEIFPALSTCIQSFVCAFCRKFVAEPLSWKRLYANFISSSVQCCNETKIERKKNLLLFFILGGFAFYDFKVLSV